jgi:hypothetical protein
MIAFGIGVAVGVASTWAVYRYRVLPELIAQVSIYEQELRRYGSDVIRRFE